MATLQEFLVNLGFKVDQGQYNRFMDYLSKGENQILRFGKGMTGILEQFATLATAATGAAATVEAAMIRIAANMSNLSFQAGRVGASAANIRALEYAFKQMGLASGDASQTLESLATTMRNKPGILQAIDPLIKPGTDTAEALLELGRHWQTEISRGAAGMSQAMQEGALLGVGQREILQLAQNAKIRGFFTEEQGREQTGGMDINKLSTQGVEITRLFNRLKEQLDDIALFFAQTFGADVEKGLRYVTETIDKYLPDIEKRIKGFHDDLTSLFGGHDLDHPLIDWQTAFDLAGLAAALVTMRTIFAGIRGVMGAFRGLIGLGAGAAGARAAAGAAGAGGAEGGGLWALLLGIITRIPQIAAALAVVAQHGDTPTHQEAPGSETFGEHGPIANWWNRNMPAWTTGGTKDDPLINLFEKYLGYNSVLLRWFRGQSDKAANQIQKDSFFGIPFGGGDSFDPNNVVLSAFRALTGGGGGYGGGYGGGGITPIPPAGPGMAAQEAALAADERQGGLPAGLLDAIWAHESGRGRNMGPSSSGALGPFQFLPSTARQWGLKNPFDFTESAAAATNYLHYMLGLFHGNIQEALGGYSQGEGSIQRLVNKYGSNWLAHASHQTQEYIARVAPPGGAYGWRPRGGDGGSRPTVHAPTNINITGVSDPQRAAAIIDRKIDRRNQNIVRHMGATLI